MPNYIKEPEATITNITLDASKAWQPAASGDYAVVSVKGGYTFTIRSPVNASSPMRVGIEMVQDGVNGYQAILSGVVNPGGVTWSQGTGTDQRDYIEIIWSGVDWIITNSIWDIT